MEPSFIGTPYVTANAPNSEHIRRLLDQQEVEYADWRRNRKPLRHPFASPKLNSPLKAKLAQDKLVAKPLWISLLDHGKDEERPKSPASQSDGQRRRSSATIAVPSGRLTPLAGARDAARASPRLGSSASSPGFSLPSAGPGRNQSDRHNLGTTKRESSRETNSQSPSPDLSPRRRRAKPSIAKTNLQKHLYSFHTRLVYSIAPLEPRPTSEVPECVQLADHDDRVKDAHPNSGVEGERPAPDIATLELPAETEDPYFVSGVSVISSDVYEKIFDHDWARSDVDRIVRDAVERKRIYTTMKSRYRVVFIFFRHYASKIALLNSPSTIAVDLQQIPTRLEMLEELNLQIVDPAKFGIVDAPLRRDGLIGFVLSVAKMVAAHSSNPVRFRMLAAEGIELSEAVRVLIEDHIVAYLQIQDRNHFRDIFLRPSATSRGAIGEACAPRRLKELLSKHEISLSNFFCDMVSIASTHSDGTHRARVPSSYRPEATMAMSFHAFVVALKALNVIAGRKADKHEVATDVGASVAATAVTLDESRVMRIFQMCLDTSAELDGRVSTRQLTYPQFVEALLRVALMLHEKVVCRGGYDECPGQHTVELCHCCESRPPDYDLAVFDCAAEELFVVIHTYRLSQSRKRTATKIKSLRTMNLSGGAVHSGLPRRHHRHGVSAPQEGGGGDVAPSSS